MSSNPSTSTTEGAVSSPNETRNETPVNVVISKRDPNNSQVTYYFGQCRNEREIEMFRNNQKRAKFVVKSKLGIKALIKEMKKFTGVKTRAPGKYRRLSRMTLRKLSNRRIRN